MNFKKINVFGSWVQGESPLTIAIIQYYVTEITKLKAKTHARYRQTKLALQQPYNGMLIQM